MVTDFEFANRRLSEFGFVVGHVTTSGDTKTISIGSEITFNTVKNNYSSVHSVTSSSYENVYTTELEIFKRNCNNNRDDMILSLSEIRQITKWLNRRGYHKFKPFDCSMDEDIHHYGSFNVDIITIAGDAIGLYLHFTSNAPYSFGEACMTKHILLNSTDRMAIWGDGDEFHTIYPKVKIKCFSDGNLILTNHTTGNVIDIKNCKNGEIITIDGEHKVIFSSKEDIHSTLPNDFNYSYFDILIDEYGIQNEYSSTIPCEISVVYMPIKKVGAY